MVYGQSTVGNRQRMGWQWASILQNRPNGCHHLGWRHQLACFWTHSSQHNNSQICPEWRIHPEGWAYRVTCTYNKLWNHIVILPCSSGNNASITYYPMSWSTRWAPNTTHLINNRIYNISGKRLKYGLNDKLHSNGQYSFCIFVKKMIYRFELYIEWEARFDPRWLPFPKENS